MIFPRFPYIRNTPNPPDTAELPGYFTEAVYKFAADTRGQCWSCCNAYEVGDVVVRLGTADDGMIPVLHWDCFKEESVA